MYKELIKSLRICGDWTEQVRLVGRDCGDGCKYQKDGVCESFKGNKELLLIEAADAIEELQKVASKLLAKYQEEATSVIWEYSGNINESIDFLNEEVRTLMAQINGMPLPEPPKGETDG